MFLKYSFKKLPNTYFIISTICRESGSCLVFITCVYVCSEQPAAGGPRAGLEYRAGGEGGGLQTWPAHHRVQVHPLARSRRGGII